MRISENLQVFLLHSAIAFIVYLIALALLYRKVNINKLLKTSLTFYLILIVYTFSFAQFRNVIDSQTHYEISRINGPILIGVVLGHSVFSAYGLTTSQLDRAMKILGILTIAVSFILLLVFFTISLFVSNSLI